MAQPCPAVASSLVRMTTEQDAAEQVMLALLADNMDPDAWLEYQRIMSLSQDDDDHVGPEFPVELFYCWLEQATGKPVSAVFGLSSIMTHNWGVIRGKLILAGIARPSRDIDFAGLLDATEMIVRETHKDEKESKKFTNQLYQPRVKRGGAKKTRPAGFSNDDMAAQARALAALG